MYRALKNENMTSIFRFYCRSDLPKYALGALGEKAFVIHFYLSDDTVEVREMREEEGKIILSQGRDAGNDNEQTGKAAAGTKYLKRQRLAKEITSFGKIRALLYFDKTNHT